MVVEVGAATGMDWPSWIQACASVLALGIAVGVPFYFHFREKRKEAERNRLRSRATVILIFPDVASVLTRLQWMERQWKEKDFHDGSEDYRLAKMGDLEMVEWGRLEARVDRIAELEPELSSILLQLISSGSHYNEALTRIRKQDGAEKSVAAFEALEEALEVNRRMLIPLATSAVKIMARKYFGEELPDVEEKEKA